MSSIETREQAPWRFIDVPDSAWENNGWDGENDDPTPTRLHGGTVWLNGSPMHLEAIEVQRREGVQQTVNQDDDQDLNRLSELQQGALAETTINGRQYVVFLTPHQY